MYKNVRYVSNSLNQFTGYSIGHWIFGSQVQYHVQGLVDPAFLFQKKGVLNIVLLLQCRSHWQCLGTDICFKIDCLESVVNNL